MTPIAIHPGEKFAAIAVTEVWVADAVPDIIDLGNGLWATRHPPVDIGAVWIRWLGDITVRELERADVWLIAKAASARPNVIDDENERLKAAAGHLFHSLLLAHPIQLGLVFRLNGGNDGTISIRGFEGLDHYFHTQGLEAPLETAGLELARRVMDGLIALQDPGTWRRIGRGLLAFWHGLTERYFEDRLHQFVRSLEGPTKPEIGATRSQFVHRCQTFARASMETRQILEGCFDIRSQVEHIHDWRNALPNLSQEEQVNRLGSHTRRIETLSRRVYQRLALTPAVRDQFRDDTIDAFWRIPDDERRRLWGDALDVSTIH